MGLLAKIRRRGHFAVRDQAACGRGPSGVRRRPLTAKSFGNLLVILLFFLFTSGMQGYFYFITLGIEFVLVERVF